MCTNFARPRFSLCSGVLPCAAQIAVLPACTFVCLPQSVSLPGSETRPIYKPSTNMFICVVHCSLFRSDARRAVATLSHCHGTDLQKLTRILTMKLAQALHSLHAAMHDLILMIGLLYKACPDGCQQVLLRLRPYPVRGHRPL